MKKASFKTKLTKKQKRKNILVFLGVIVGLYAVTLLFGHGIGIFDDWTSLESYLLAFFMTFFICSMILVPVISAAIILGAQKGRARRVMEDASFIPVHNMDYYRDNLGGLAPSQVSLLIDLNLYGKKDIVATLLSMQNKKAIRFEKNGRISEVAEHVRRIDDSELELLELIKTGRLNNKKALLQWKQNRFSRAEVLGYIQRKSKEEKINASYKYIGLAALSLIPAFIIWGMFLHFEIFIMDSALDALRAFAIVLLWDFFIFVPWYLAMKQAGYISRFDVLWERTPLGNEVAEKIAGLSRFIHEFSLLSEAKQDQVALWDEYLVYAIVLEENELIVDEISKRYKIHLPNL